MKLKSLHVHVVVDVPGKEDAEMDLLINDPDGNGDPNYHVKWDLPGELLDSGDPGIKGELPVGTLIEPVISAVIGAVEHAAPAPLKPVLGLIESALDGD